MISKGTNILRENSKNRLKFNPDLQQINFLDRRVYKRGEDLYYPSVTTILQYMPKNKFFETWLKDVGHNADYIMKRAGKEGTQVHEAVERLLEGEEVSWMDDYGNAKYNESVWGMVMKFVECWKTINPELIATEEFTFSDEHRYAGTADIVCRFDNEVWLLDVKTSNSLHKSYDLQLAAYAKAWEEQTGQKIDKTGIIWLKSTKRSASKKDGVYQGKGWELKVVEDIDENFELFKLIYKLYALENPTTEPIYKEYPTTLRL